MKYRLYINYNDYVLWEQKTDKQYWVAIHSNFYFVGEFSNRLVPPKTYVLGNDPNRVKCLESDELEELLQHILIDHLL